ncbi:MAG: lipopolysaccharide biosynthesis protein [Bryobacterales bacterium]|nr:lipopolysaccharide biosynthesis protein [Bryobacterales bacterium]
MSPGSDDNPRKLDLHFAGGVAWTAGAKWVTQLLSWASVFVLARLLSKSDFGISEMASYSFLLTNILAEFGIGTAVLQMRELERGTLAQLHAFSCLLAALAYLASIPCAPLIASFFHVEHLTSLILVNNLAFFFTGFQAVPLGMLRRDMDYRRLSLVDALQILVQSVTVIAAAWWGLGYWSLIIGVGAARATGSVLISYWKPIPFAIPRWRDIRAPIQLGRQAAIGNLAWTCYTQADGVVVGRVLGDSVLGVYRIATTLASAPAEKVSALIMRTTGPLFAKVQSDAALVRRYFLNLMELLTLIELPLMLGLGVIAREATAVILGPNWTGVVPILRWLVLFMTMRTLATLIDQVLLSQRATRFSMRMSLWNLLVMPAAFVVGAKWAGASGVAAAWIVLSPLTFFPLVWMVSRKIQVTSRQMGTALLPGLAGASVMVAAVGALRVWLPLEHWPPLASLLLQVTVGAAMYAGVLLTFFRERVLRFVYFLRDLRREKEVQTGTAQVSE